MASTSPQAKVGDYISSVANTAFSFRNKIINGKMEISQRGTGPFTSAGYTLDRFTTQYSMSGALSISQSADKPDGFTNSLALTVTTTNPSVTASQYCLIRQIVEGYNIQDLINRPISVSFWVKSSKTGTYSASIRTPNTTAAYVREYTINSANTWEQKTFSIQNGLHLSGSWGVTNGAGLYIDFPLLCGTDFKTSSVNQWVIGTSPMASTNQVNLFDTNGATFLITGIQLEVGSVSTPFEHRPVTIEAELCARYYRVIGPIQCSGSYDGTSAIKTTSVHFFPHMRAYPTLSASRGYGSGATSGTVTAITWSTSSINDIHSVNAAAGWVSTSYTLEAEL